MTALAAAPSFVLGMALVRGRPTIVVSGAALLTGEQGRGGRWVSLRTAAAAVVEVDEVIGVRTVPAMAEVPALLHDLGAVSTIGELDRELFLVLGGAKQLSEEVAQETRAV